MSPGDEGIKANQRVLFVGETRSGKSELLNHVLTYMRPQRFLLDTKGGEWQVEGVEPTTSVETIDFSQPLIHYVTQTDDIEEIDAIFDRLRRRRQMVVAVHELGDLCGFSTNRTPRNVSSYFSKGGAHQLGLLGASQLPVDMPIRGKTEVQHVFCVVPALGEEHLKAVAKIGIGVTWQELQELLGEVEAAHGEHSYIWFRKGMKGFTVCPPLSPETIKHTIITRAPGVS